MIITINGVALFYERTGQGAPIILLHGNGEDHGIFDVLTKQLSNQYTVYAIDSRNHGQSSKGNELNYTSMTNDIASFIQELKLKKPILYGFSDGGIIGLLLTIQYPTMLSKLIISGANLTPKGLKTNYMAFIKILSLFTRNPNLKMMLTQPQIKESELKKFKVPTLVLAGSRDLIKESHTRFIASKIPHSTLLILKGEHHGSYIIHSEKLYEVIKPFLDS